jgi:hypothetical protein
MTARTTPTITEENYEEYILLHVDDELDGATTQALFEFLALHPEFDGDLQAYSTARLSPEPTLLFPDKEALLRPQPGARLISLSGLRRVAAIAALLLLTIGAWFLSRREPKSEGRVATSHSPAKPNVDSQPHNPRNAPTHPAPVVHQAEVAQKTANPSPAVPLSAGGVAPARLVQRLR